MLACEYVNSTVSSGSALVRDLRTWHGGAPNNSTVTRFLPNIEAVSQQYIAHLEQVGERMPSRALGQDLLKKLRDCSAYCGVVKASTPIVHNGVTKTFAKLQNSLSTDKWKRKGKGKHKSKGVQNYTNYAVQSRTTQPPAIGAAVRA